MRRYGYEDTDKKILINIYGIDFEIKNLEEENIEKLRNVNKDLDTIEKEIENILGEGSVKKLNDQREKDGYEKMTLNIELAILGCVFETYANEVTKNITDKVTNSIDAINKKMNGINRQNRYNRRNYRRY